MTTLYKGSIAPSDHKLWDGSTADFSRDTDTGGTETLNRVMWPGVDVFEIFGGRTSSEISSALTRIGSNTVSIWLAPGTWTISDNLTIPSNVGVVVPDGTTLSISSGKTLTVNGRFYAGNTQCVSGSGTMALAATSVAFVKPEWWGDHTSAALQSAVTAAGTMGGGVVLCDAGTYTISSMVTVPSNVSISGSCTVGVDTSEAPDGTTFNRTADVIAIYISADSNIKIKGVRFTETANISDKAFIDAVDTDSVKLEDVVFWQNENPTTVGHTIDAENCKDWMLNNVNFVYYANSGDTKFAINIYNGDTGNCKDWALHQCRFINGQGRAIVSDSSGSGNTNTGVVIGQCVFDDSDQDALRFISGAMEDVKIEQCRFLGCGQRHINITSTSKKWGIVNNHFQNSKNAPTEFIVVSGDYCIISGNTFEDGAASVNYYIDVQAAAASTVVSGNIVVDSVDLVDDTTGSVPDTTRIFGNTGYVDSNAGSAVLGDGSSAVNVAHGLSFTPRREDITLTPKDTRDSVAMLVPDGVGSTNISVQGLTSAGATVTLSTGDINFYWSARRTHG